MNLADPLPSPLTQALSILGLLGYLMGLVLKGSLGDFFLEFGLAAILTAWLTQLSTVAASKLQRVTMTRPDPQKEV